LAEWSAVRFPLPRGRRSCLYARSCYLLCTSTLKERAVRGQDQGTFIIRFAERHPGYFGIACALLRYGAQFNYKNP
jgi:hypothetical protein